MDNGANSPFRTNFLATTKQVADDHGIAHEILGPEDIRSRYPQFSLQEGEFGYLEPGGGHLSSERCVAAHRTRAKDLGAGLQLGTRVLSLSTAGDGVQVTTDRETIHASRVIVSAGP